MNYQNILLAHVIRLEQQERTERHGHRAEYRIYGKETDNLYSNLIILKAIGTVATLALALVILV
jgi:hypothetical protein